MKIIDIEQDGPIGFTADHHIGNHGVFGGPLRGGLNDRARLCIAGVRSAISLLRTEGCVAHVLLGDLFDVAKPRPAMIRGVQKIFKAAAMPQICLLGNHEHDSAEPDDNALSPLSDVAHVVLEPTIVRTPSTEVWCVPYIPSDTPFAQRLDGYLHEFAAAPRDCEYVVLALHVGISDDRTPPWLRASDCMPFGELRTLAKGHGINRVISGDWHEHKSWGNRFIQCGALTPTGFDNPGLDDYGQVHILEGETLRTHVVPGPRFINLTSTDDYEPPDQGGLIYAQITTTSESYTRERAAADELVKAGVLAGARVRVDRQELRTQARQAAGLVRSSSTLGGAALAYAETMPLPAGEVDRRIIGDRLRGLLVKHQAPEASGARTVTVRTIQIQGFAATDAEQTLELPKRGLVVVEGGNGSGKTSLIEAVAHAGWDQSIKDGAKGCWRDVRDGSIASIQLQDGTWITRAMNSRRKKVRIIPPGETQPDFELPTKARARLEALLGDFKIWRSTCVFTSTSKSFTGASDGERKRMLERVLDLSVFDSALDDARTQLKDADARAVDLERALAVSRTKAVGLDKRLEDHAAQLEHLRTSAPELRLPAEPDDYDLDLDGDELPPVDLDGAREALEGVELHARDRGGELARARAELDQRQRELRSLDLRSECPTCGGPLDTSAARARAEQLTAELEPLRAVVERAEQDALGANRELAAARKRLELARSQDQARRAREQQRARRTEARKRWQGDCEKARAEHQRRLDAHAHRVQQLEEQFNALEIEQFDLEDEIEATRAELGELEHERVELRACIDALGLKGIRAHLMSDLLATIETLANRWLEELGDLRVHLRPYTPGSDGAVKDEIHLEIVGAGGGHYGDCSQGQQRRIDIAILLALSEATGGLGRDASTLFFDEVFDALDPQGVAAVASVIRELARERCCVVITHVPQLAHELRAKMLVTVNAGKLSISKQQNTRGLIT